MIDEREAAQWYATGGSEHCRPIADAFPDPIKRRCFQFGSLVNWQRLPTEAKEAFNAKRISQKGRA
jgi:hypothetical protein